RARDDGDRAGRDALRRGAEAVRPGREHAEVRADGRPGLLGRHPADLVTGADEDLAFVSAIEQARLVRAGEVTSVELAELDARRIEALDGRVGAYLTLCIDRALDEAGAVAAGDPRPFAGVPIPIKDLYDTAGVRTTFGSGAFADRLPDADEES